jgi:hypothetical protein
VKRTLLGALAVILIVAGCTAVAHLKALQPKLTSNSPRLSVPKSATVRQPTFQAGIDVDAFTFRGQDFAAASATLIAYAKTLQANSLSISFPFFMSSRSSTRVFATSRTPTPAELALLIADAERAGLYVSLRPLLSEATIGHSRVAWKPAHPVAWFASYERFLMPYARMAQANKVGEFIVGAEFAKFGSSPLWNHLDRVLATVFHGKLAYSNNDTKGLSRSAGGRLTVKTVDAYHPIHPPFLRGWKSFDRSLPARTVLTEVGISATDGAWRQPWVHRSQGMPIDPRIQVRWFTAACEAAIATGLRGIYFWSLPLSTRFPGPTPGAPGAWGHSAGAAAVARCFGSVK